MLWRQLHRLQRFLEKLCVAITCQGPKTNMHFPACKKSISACYHIGPRRAQQAHPSTLHARAPHRGQKQHPSIRQAGAPHRGQKKTPRHSSRRGPAQGPKKHPGTRHAGAPHRGQKNNQALATPGPRTGAKTDTQPVNFRLSAVLLPHRHRCTR